MERNRENNNLIDYSPWCVAIILVVFDESQGQVIRCVYPSNNLSEQVLNDIKMLAMPDCLPAGSNHQLQYLIRVRDKQQSNSSSSSSFSSCYNCFVSFTQSRDSSFKRGFSQRSLVLVCKHTFSTLAHSVLYQLGNVIDNLFKSSSSASSSNNNNNTIATDTTNNNNNNNNNNNANNITAAIEVAYQHFLGWPSPKAGEKLLLPFYGEIVVFNVPTLMTYVDCGIDSTSGNVMNELIEKNHVNTGLGGGVGLFGDEDLVGLFKTFGLLPHIWLLWELVVTGKDILIWAPSPDICSRIITALVSLVAPLSYGGDFRPYLNPYDNDIKLISSVSQKKYEMKVKSKDDPTCKSCLNTNLNNNWNENNNLSIDSSLSTIFDFSYNITSEFPSPKGTNLVSNGTRVGTLDIPTHDKIFTDFHDMNISYSTSVIDVNNDNNDNVNINGDNNIPTITPPIIRAISRNNTYINQNQGSSLGNCANPSKHLTSLIVGITNPFLLKSFSHFDVAIFLPMCSLSPIKFLSGPNLGSPSHIDTIVKVTTDGSISPHSAARSRKKSLYSSRSSTNDNNNKSNLNESIRFINTEFSCSINRVNINTSLEDIHERWIQSGGAGTVGNGKGSSLLTFRDHISAVKPDSRIVQLLWSPSIADDVNKEKNFSFSSYFDEEFDNSREIERDSIMRNMLVREHFRQLTYSLMKPFESHFQPKSFPIPESTSILTSSSSPSSSPPPSSSLLSSILLSSSSSSLSSSAFTSTTTTITTNSSQLNLNSYSKLTSLSSSPSRRHLPLSNGGLDIFDPTSNIVKTLPPNGINLAISPTRRIGASFLWLYRNPLELLGNESLSVLVQNYRKNSKLIPNCFIPSKIQSLYVSFGESDTFQNFYQWRRKHLSVQLMMEMALACSMLTGDELIEQFAIEKGSDVVTQKQVRELTTRISLYIQTLNNIQTDSISTKQDLIERMSEHLIVISNLCDSMSK